MIKISGLLLAWAALFLGIQAFAGGAAGLICLLMSLPFIFFSAKSVTTHTHERESDAFAD